MWSHTTYEPVVGPKSFYGLEIRGLMSQMVRHVEVTRVDDPYGWPSTLGDTNWAVRIDWTAPSVVDEGRPIQLTFTGHYRAYPDPKDRHGRELTPEQNVLQQALRCLWQHEFEEALWMGNKPLEEPDQIHSK